LKLLNFLDFDEAYRSRLVIVEILYEFDERLAGNPGPGTKTSKIYVFWIAFKQKFDFSVLGWAKEE
jgi:hypothetical protein